MRYIRRCRDKFESYVINIYLFQPLYIWYFGPAVKKWQQTAQRLNSFYRKRLHDRNLSVNLILM